MIRLYQFLIIAYPFTLRTFKSIIQEMFTYCVLSLINTWSRTANCETLINEGYVGSKKISNDQELIQSDPISCPQNQKGNN